MLVHRPRDRSVVVVVQRMERLAKSEGSLEWRRVRVEPTRSCVGLPCDGPEPGEVVPVRAPEPAAPFAEVEVPERVVDRSRLPIEDARELATDNQQLVLMDVPVNEHMGMSGAGLEQLG